MHHFHCFVLSFRKNFFSFLLVFFTICLIFFSSSNIAAAKNGLSLWASSVIPALFPFFVATELLSHTPLIAYLGKKLNKFMRPCFRVPGEGSFALLMGMISGYPMGAKIVTDFRNQGICTKEEGERLLAFTNNSGPLFILGTVGIGFFADTTIGLVLLATHILSCLTIGLLFRFWKPSHFSSSHSSLSAKQSSKRLSFSNLGELMSSSIMKASSTLIMIGGFVVLFSVILSILKQSHLTQMITSLLTPIASLFHFDINFLAPLLNGFFEITNGIKQIASIPQATLSINIILCAFLLGFGGISVLLQVWSIISKSDLSILPYFLGKLLQGVIAAFYTYLVFRFMPFLSLDLIPTSVPLAGHSKIPSLLPLLLFVVILFFFWCRKKSFTHKKKKLEYTKMKGV